MQRGFLPPSGRGRGRGAPAAPADTPPRLIIHFPEGAAYAVYQPCGRGVGCACKGCTLAGQQVEPPLPAPPPGTEIVVVDLGYAAGELSDYYSDAEYSDAEYSDSACMGATESSHADQRGRPRSASPTSSDLQFTHQRRLNDTPSERSESQHATSGATAPPSAVCVCGERIVCMEQVLRQFKSERVAWANAAEARMAALEQRAAAAPAREAAAQAELRATQQRLQAAEQQIMVLQQQLRTQQSMQPPCMAPAQPTQPQQQQQQQQQQPVQAPAAQRPQQQRAQPMQAPPPPAPQQQRVQPMQAPPAPAPQQQPPAPQQSQRPRLAPHLQQQQEQWPALSSAPAQRPQPQPRSEPAPAPATVPAAAAAAAPSPGPKPSPSPVPQRRRNAGQLPAHFQESLPYRKQFSLQSHDALFPASGSTLSEQLDSFLCSRFQLSAGTVSIVDAARVNATSVFFSVDTLQQATLLVGKRSLLKGSGVTLYEVLSPQERAQHARLMPQFLAARQAGQRVQFSRAQLFVDRVLVTPSP